MIDFDALVLGPAQDIFARPVTVLPLKSQPGQPAYRARGIYTLTPADQPLEDGMVGTDNHTLSVRGSELPAPVIAGDKVFIPAHLSLPALGWCDIADDGWDGQGTYGWVLKILKGYTPP